MRRHSSLSVVVPALNEELNLEATLRNIQETVPLYFDDWEILIFDDGSTDTTGRIADRLASSEVKIRVAHHKTPWNIGGCYREGIRQASKDYVIMIPGDNECGPRVMSSVFSLAGQADMIVPYTNNLEVRPPLRRALSRVFVHLVNLISGQGLRYYNGAVLHRTSILKGCRFSTNGFGYQAEILLRLLRQGHSYVEVPIEITYRPHGKSKALHPTSLIQVGHFFVSLVMARNEVRK